MDFFSNFNIDLLEKSSSLVFPPNQMNAPLSIIKKCQSFSLDKEEATDVTHCSIMTESFNQTNCNKSIEVLDLSSFKTQPCATKSQHNFKTCFYYHNTKDRRRIGSFYSSDLCEYADKSIELCPLTDFCNKSHNRLEQLYHCDKYKTKFCSHFPRNIQNCDYGIYCSFAHAENEILVDLIHNYDYDEDFFLFHYKTVWCPFNLTQHDKGLCVYAHNWQDFRRKPHLYNYEPFSCPNWNHNQIVANYEDGCPNNLVCIKCHGWKENEFHPLNYRTKPCPNLISCNRGFACPFYHNIKDKRVISSSILSQYFKLFPRNRIICNTFKIRRNSATTISKSTTLSNNGYNNLNPVIEEFEKESAQNKFRPMMENSFEAVIDGSEQNKHEACFSTPSKRNIVFTERDRKFSESVPATEKFDKKWFLTPDHQDKKEQRAFQLFGKHSLENLDIKQEYLQTKKSNDDLSNSKDDDFGDLIDEINKITQ